MVKKSVAGLNVIVALCCIIIMICQGNWVLLCLAGMLLSGTFYLWSERQREYGNELGEISGCLDDLLQRKNISDKSVQKDTISAKILSQIQRVETMYLGAAALLEDERDAMKQLFAGIAHQLRTPLSNMETYLALLEDDCIDEKERKDYIRAVARSENKLSFLIEKFIVSARLENRMIQIHKCAADLRNTVAQAVFQVYKKANEKNINIEVQGADDDTIVCHDSNWVCEAVYNLLDNSIKYSPESSEIIITLLFNEMFSEIRIEDSGTGVAAGEENKIFQLYYRGKNVSNQEGYGMGLFIAREIILKHGGFIRAERKNQGMIMSIVLPKAGT